MKSNEKKVNNTNVSIGEQIYNELKHKIISLEFEPGELISEHNISNIFNASRTPVKNSFVRLEIEGLITVKPQVGSYVSKMRKDKIIQLLTMRMLLEISIMPEVRGKVTKEEIEQLKLIIKRQEEALETEKSILEKAKVFWDLDNEFHSKIFKIAKKDFLWEYIQNDLPHINRFRLLSCTIKNDSMDKIVEDHKKILDNMESGAYNFEYLYKNHILEDVEENFAILRLKHPEFIDNE